MNRLALWLLLPMALCAGQARYARLGDFDGKVEVQLQAADSWQPALRNMPVSELAWLRTAGSSRVELELDEGSVLRLAADSLAELSDYTRLSTGQRVTLVSLDRGMAYFSGAADGKDALILAVPGAQVTIRAGARIRLEASDQWSQIAALEGKVRFSSPTAEFDLTEGQMARVNPVRTAKFYLYPEITPHDSDRWNDERDKVLASTGSAGHVPGLRYGLADLDAQGAWIDSAEFGAVWKPKAPEAWAPFRNGKWLWYDALGYTWISADKWGWLPYHYGRWMQQEGMGWIWLPGKSDVFLPGEVYWLKSAKLAGWGPLAAGEEWKPPAAPRLFLNMNTTYAQFDPEAREVDPADFTTRPAEPPAAAVFMLALPSPSFPAARLEADRPTLRAGSTRVTPVLDGVTFEAPAETVVARAADAPAARAYDSGPVAQQPVVIVNTPPPAPDPPAESYYPVPVYTGIVVIDPPVRPENLPAHTRPKATAPAAQTPEPPPPTHHPEPTHDKPQDSDKPGK